MKNKPVIVKISSRTRSKSRRPRRVIVVVDITKKAGRDIFYGISRFTHMRPEWSISLFDNPGSLEAKYFTECDSSGYDGMLLATNGLTNTALSKAILRSSMPVVCLGEPGMLSRRRRRIAFLRGDNLETGAAGARYLASLGNWRTLAFVSRMAPGMYWSPQRREGFVSEAKDMGCDCRTFECKGAQKTQNEILALKNWLSKLPKPCAIMAATDVVAAMVIEACNELKLGIPRTVSVLGVDDDVSLCDFLSPSLSSILPDHERVGFAGARELESLMNARESTPARTLPPLPPLRIVERETTATAATPASRLIIRALEYIRVNAAKPIKVEDVVRHIGVSRRLADLRFRELHGKSILETIMEHRMEEVARRLSMTNQSIISITRECGFSNASYLKTLFKRHFGKTMSEWRAENCR